MRPQKLINKSEIFRVSMINFSKCFNFVPNSTHCVKKKSSMCVLNRVETINWDIIVLIKNNGVIQSEDEVWPKTGVML